jgi:two-component system, response regulator YesN
VLKILIADDEENIRKGLKAAVYWEQYGYEICGEAENGIEALEMACELRPDLIIVDIRMPGMDGLQMVRKFREMDGNSRIIILSGYSEFQYAKQSIELGVEVYLLKPIDEVELTAQIVRIGNSIMGEKRQKDVFNDSLAAARNGLVVKLVADQFSEDILYKANDIFCMNLPWKTYQVMLVDISNTGFRDWDMKNEFKGEIVQFVEKNNYGYVFNNDGIMGVLLKDVCFDDNTRQLEYLYKLLLEKQKTDTLFVIGPCSDNINDIQLSYEYAERMMKNKFIWGSQRIIGYKKDIVEGQCSKSSENDLEKITEGLYTAIDVNSKEYIKMELQGLCDNMMSKNLEEAVIKSSFINICFDVFSKLKVKNENLVNLSLGNGIYLSRNILELKAYAIERFSAISDELAKGKSDGPMLKMMDYIRKNYNQQLKIENLAQMFGYNSIYLGQLFKNHTGMYFNSYLEKVRIDRARELLMQGLKVYQVAEQIGFNNLDYFSSKFKKHTGASPSDYKCG